MTTLELWATVEEALARLGTAAIAGAMIGINRVLREKPAGVRTHALVALGSALVTYSSIIIGRDFGTLPDGNAVTRAVQGIVAGVGFLGGGVILKANDRNTVRNLTTAASLWVVACIGIVAGAGQWALVLASLVLTLVVLLVGGPIERVSRLIIAFVSPPPPRDGRRGGRRERRVGSDDRRDRRDPAAVPEP